VSGKKKYLFVYLKTGGGHLAPARAIFNYLNQHFADSTEPKLIYGLRGLHAGYNILLKMDTGCFSIPANGFSNFFMQ